MLHPFGAKIRHFKPHGALYNQPRKIANCVGVVEAVAEWDPHLIFLRPKRKQMIARGKNGLRTAKRGIRRPAYRSDGNAYSQNETNALITETETSFTRFSICPLRPVRSTDGLCSRSNVRYRLHGDAICRRVRRRIASGLLDAMGFHRTAVW